MGMKFLRVLLASVVLSSCAADRVPPTSAPASPAEEFSAIFANISNVGAVGAAPVKIRITRWTGDAEHETLMGILSSKGTEALVRELTGMKAVGSIGTQQELPYELRYARQYPLEGGGRRVVLMSDRPMSALERMSTSQSRDYPLTWIDITLDAAGRGDGSISLAARLRLVGNVLGIEGLANQPAKLNEVRKIK